MSDHHHGPGTAAADEAYAERAAHFAYYEELEREYRRETGDEKEVGNVSPE
ncbi:MAG TPA: hypothetical protein VF595_05955 [Tepidisphaeraceae bacterium]|jgi:hypothetical protein